MDNHDDDIPLPPNDHHQPVNLLALQQEIIQTASIQTFFASLAPLTMDTLCSDNNSESNGCTNAEAPSDDSMMATNSVHPPIKLLTLHQYLDHLPTTECFIPACILHWLDLKSFQMYLCKQQLMSMTNASFLQNPDYQNTCTPLSQYLSYPAPLLPHTAASWFYQINLTDQQIKYLQSASVKIQGLYG